MQVEELDCLECPQEWHSGASPASAEHKMRILNIISENNSSKRNDAWSQTT